MSSVTSSRPLERGWRKVKEGTPGPPKVPLRQEVVSVTGQRRGQRIVVPVKKLFAREKRPYGLGMVGKLTNRTYRKRIDSYVKRQIEDMDDHRYCTTYRTHLTNEHFLCASLTDGWWTEFFFFNICTSASSRPFFTYWITFVHLLITILAVCIYGIAPVGFSQHETVDSVSNSSVVIKSIVINTPSQYFILKVLSVLSYDLGFKKQRCVWKCQVCTAGELLDRAGFGKRCSLDCFLQRKKEYNNNNV